MDAYILTLLKRLDELERVNFWGGDGKNGEKKRDPGGGGDADHDDTCSQHHSVKVIKQIDFWSFLSPGESSKKKRKESVNVYFYIQSLRCIGRASALKYQSNTPCLEMGNKGRNSDSPTTFDLLSRKTQIRFGGDDTEGIGMTLPATPSLNTDDVVAIGQDTELDGLGDSPFETSVDVLLPIVFVEIGLGLLKKEWVDTTIQVRILPDC